MKLALFGGTGTVGSQLLAQAVRDGHEVWTLVRDPGRLPGRPEAVHVVHGVVADRGAVDAVVSGSEAVLSAPGGTNRSAPDVLRCGSAVILDSMAEHGPRRLVAVQGFHLPFPGDPHNAGRLLIRAILRAVNHHLLEDSIAMAALLCQSEADWTLVRAPRISSGTGTGRYRTGSLALGPWNKVRAGDVASFMLECATAGSHLREAPMIAEARRHAMPDEDPNTTGPFAARRDSGR